MKAQKSIFLKITKYKNLNVFVLDQERNKVYLECKTLKILFTNVGNSRLGGNIASILQLFCSLYKKYETYEKVYKYHT